MKAITIKVVDTCHSERFYVETDAGLQSERKVCDSPKELIEHIADMLEYDVYGEG